MILHLHHQMGIFYFTLNSDLCFYYNLNIDFAMLQSTSLTNFVPLAKIGEGSFSSVYQVRRVTDNKSYALKKVRYGRLR
jgi:serine/threonine protein kinase